MTPDMFSDLIDQFFQRCGDVMRRKNRDYSPDTIPMMEVFVAAFEEGISPESMLRVYLRKHWAAIRTWTLGGYTHSEPPDGRMIDAANFIAILSVLAQADVRDRIIAEVIRIRGTECVCGCVRQMSAGQFQINSALPPCEHGQLCQWLAKFCVSLDGRLESWPTTQRALVSFHTDRTLTGDTPQQGHLPLHFAIPEATRRTTGGKLTH
jgi:hypothetical protein